MRSGFRAGAQAAPCSTLQHRQFDFWLGNWDVILPGGSLRQHWEISADGGSSWTTIFDGRYARATSPGS